MRVAAGRLATLRFRLEDGDGNLVEPDDDALPTVAVLDGAGAAVDLVGATVTEESPGTFAVTLPAQPKLDQLTATWTAVLDDQTITEAQLIEVVGPRLVPLWRLREDPDLGTVDAEVLRDVLDGVEQLFAAVLPVPPVREGVRVRFDRMVPAFGQPTAGGGHLNLGGGLGFGGRLMIPGVGAPQVIYSMSIGGSALSSNDLALIAAGEGDLVWTDGRPWPPGNYVAWLVNGLPDVPRDLFDAGLAAIRHYVRRRPVAGQRRSRLSERISALSTGGATMVFNPITPERPTGLDEVDATLNRYMADEGWI